MKKISFRSLAVRAAHAADSKKGADILLLDVRKTTALASYFLIVSAESSAHMMALAEHLRVDFNKQGVQLLHTEGRSKRGRWAVLDYGGLIIHILERETREFYALERLWTHNSRSVRWDKNGKKEKS